MANKELTINEMLDEIEYSVKQNPDLQDSVSEMLKKIIQLVNFGKKWEKKN